MVKIEGIRQLIEEADYVLIGAGAGLTAAAGLDYAGEDFRQAFGEWIDRYGITDLYSASFYPFKTEEEFREKVDNVLSQTPELRKLNIHLGSLSLDDM